MRKLHFGALDMIECHHGVPLDTECPKCMEVAICGADAPPELTEKETILMARITELEKDMADFADETILAKRRIAELEGALEKLVNERSTSGRKEIARAALTGEDNVGNS
jgi:chromosomal replication initiation ATPase DnaA